MDKKDIAAFLKAQRMQSGLSVAEVKSKLNAAGIKVAEKTIYGYENGVSMPGIPTFIALCDIYNVSDIVGSFK